MNTFILEISCSINEHPRAAKISQAYEFPGLYPRIDLFQVRNRYRLTFEDLAIARISLGP